MSVDANSKESNKLLQKGEATISWRNLRVRSKPGCWNRLLGSGKKKQRVLLDNAAGYAQPGSLLAIIGASGAGKSTLLNALTLRTFSGIQIDSGRVFVNGELTTAERLSGLSVYMQQKDIFLAVLTVKEHLVMQARLRIGHRLAGSERLTEVDFVIKQFELTQCADTRIGDPLRQMNGISGGERKRLALATEILSNPSIMFCDEPITGLDSSTAEDVIEVLKLLAAQGRSIIITVHQPSSDVFALFDRIMLLCDGRMAFQGTRDDAQTFFTRVGFPSPKFYNPADHYVNMLSSQYYDEDVPRLNTRPGFICDQFLTSDEGKRFMQELEDRCKVSIEKVAKKDVQTDAERNAEEDAEIDNNFTSAKNKKKKPELTLSWKKYCAAPWWEQLNVLVYRTVLVTIREPLIWQAKVGQSFFIALILGAIYFGQSNPLTQESVMNINGAIFVALIQVSFSNAILVINVFCAEKPLFLREYGSGLYRVHIYYIAKQLAELPMFTMNTLLFTVIFYWMIGLINDDARFLNFAFVIFLITWTAIGFGYMMSCISPTVEVASAATPALVTPMLLFAGYFIHQDSMPAWLSWLKYTSWFYYGMDVLMGNQWINVTEIQCNNATRCFPDGPSVLEFHGYYVDQDYLRDGFALLGLMFGFRIIGFIVLKCTCVVATRRNL